MENKVYYSNNGLELEKREDGLYVDKGTDVLYMIVDDKPKALLDQASGAPLFPKENGYFGNKYTEIESKVTETGKVIALIDPRNGGAVHPNETGQLVSKYSAETFTVYKEHVIPEWDPVTKGKAHVEDGYLVSDVSGVRYEIDEHGRILTPQEIARLERSEMEAEKLNFQGQNGLSGLGNEDAVLRTRLEERSVLHRGYEKPINAGDTMIEPEAESASSELNNNIDEQPETESLEQTNNFEMRM